LYAPVIPFLYRGLERKATSPGIDGRLLGWTYGQTQNEWWTWAFMAFFCLYCLASAAALLDRETRIAGQRSMRSSLVAAGAFPVAGYVLFLSGLAGSYSVSGAALMLALWFFSIWTLISATGKYEIYQFSPSHIFEDVFNGIDDLVLVTDKNGKVLRANRRLLDMLGYADEGEVDSRDISNLVVEAEFILKTFIMMRHGFAGGGDVCVHLRSKRGVLFPVKMRSLTFGDGKVKLRGTLLIGRPEAAGFEAPAGGASEAVAGAEEVSAFIEPAAEAGKDEAVVAVSVQTDPGPAYMTEGPRLPKDMLSEGKAGDADDYGFRNLVEEALVGIFMTLNGKLIYANRKMAEIFGYGQDEIVGAMNVLDLVLDDDRKGVAEKIEKVIRTGKKSVHFSFQGIKKDGSMVDIEAQGSLGEFYGEKVFFGSLHEITERRMLEEAMRHEALHDALTSLPNRILFSDRLDVAIAKADREKNKVAVMFLDLDRFKSINDTFGHSVGDMLLQSAAGVLSGCLRESDSVARLGGDEFTALLGSIHSEEDAMVVARKILSAVNQKWVLAGHRLYITTSVGISIYPDDGRDSETLIRKADTAMYSAKSHGGNNVRFYSPFMDAGSAEQMMIENDLRVALDRDELFMHYQPFFNMAEKKISGVEALMRWNHPERGVIMPGIFIPIAEKTGLIVQIGEWALNTACIQVKKWHDRGYPALHLALNVSGIQLKDPDFVDMVQNTLSRISFDPAMLKIEITENTALQNLEEIAPKLIRLSDLGVQFVVDDFGMGYSSLHYLKRLPIRTVKIDKSFTRNLTNSEEDASIITAVIAMAKSLQLDTIAEGVETKEQAAFLSKCHCDSMQGYIYSRPLSPEAFEMFIR
jgi:diguanylate cyclase (GGDEF)-like protein/PAS domain S-box-containing protein